MRRHIYPLLLVAVLVALAAVAGKAAERTSIGKKGEIELIRPTHLGATLLPPGHYRVQHETVSGHHHVVVRQLELGRDNFFRDTGVDVARVPCRLVTFDTPPERTELHWIREADGTATVTQIRISGEGGGHVIVLEPAPVE